MSVLPNPVPGVIGTTVNFTVAGTQGSTCINDTWGGGVNCSGGFWGTKACQVTEGGNWIYTWTHNWKNLPIWALSLSPAEQCSVQEPFAHACLATLNYGATVAPPPPTFGDCNIEINPGNNINRADADRFDIELRGLVNKTPLDSNNVKLNEKTFVQIWKNPFNDGLCDDNHCFALGECNCDRYGYAGSFCAVGTGIGGEYRPNHTGAQNANEWYQSFCDQRTLNAAWEYTGGPIYCRSRLGGDAWGGYSSWIPGNLSMTMSPTKVKPGDAVTFTITLSNFSGTSNFSGNGYTYPRLHDVSDGDKIAWAQPGATAILNPDLSFLNNCSLTEGSNGASIKWVFTCTAPSIQKHQKIVFSNKENAETSIEYDVSIPSPIPNCSNLKGPASIMLPESGTYTADHESLLGQLRGNIRAGIGPVVWDPAQTSFPGTTGSTSYTWTPTIAGTYDVFCNSWNDGIAECRGNAWYVSGPLQSLCAGPNASMQVAVIPNCSAQAPIVTASEGDFTDRIEVSWTTVPSVLSYDILRNGAVCTSTNDTSFIDDGKIGCASIVPGTHYTYTVKAVFSSCLPLSGSDIGWTTGPVSLTVNMYIDTNKNGKRDGLGDSPYNGEGEGINVQIRQIPNFFTGTVTFSGDTLFPSTAGIVPGDFTGSFALRTAGDYRFTGYKITNGADIDDNSALNSTSFIIPLGSLPLKETNIIDIGIGEFATGFFQGTGGDMKANTSSITANIPVGMVMLGGGIPSAGGAIDTQGGKARSIDPSLDWKQENYLPPIPSSDIPTYDTIEKYLPPLTPFDCSTGNLPADGIFKCNAASSNFTFNDNRGYTGKKVLFIPGDLTIKRDITGNNTSGLILIVKGKVTIDKNVKGVDAFIIFEKSFNDTDSAGAGEDKKSLTINGGLVGVTSGNGLSSGLKRRQDPNTTPAEIFNLQPAYYTLFANLLGKPTVFWMGE